MFEAGCLGSSALRQNLSPNTIIIFAQFQHLNFFITGAVDFKAKFEECATGKCDKKDDTAKLADKLSGLEVKEEKDKNDNTTTDSNDNNTQVNGEKHENQDSKEEKKDSESNDKE